MNWLDRLLDPLLDRLVLKLANKVRPQLNGAIDAALDRAEDRIDTALEGLEERLLAVATKPIEDLKAALAPVITFQQQVVDAERLRADVWSQAAEIQQQAMTTLAPGARFPTHQEVEEAAKAAGMTPAADVRAAITSAASSASAAAADHLRSRLTPPRPWKEIPDR
jgi:hypothetical protein